MDKPTLDKTAQYRQIIQKILTEYRDWKEVGDLDPVHSS
jgi:hypothetical protein